MTNLARIKRLYLWKPSICKTFLNNSRNCNIDNLMKIEKNKIEILFNYKKMQYLFQIRSKEVEYI